MKTRAIQSLVLLFLGFTSHLAVAQSLEVLQAKIRSMEACRQSLQHADCKLQILDKSAQDALIQLDQLNKQSQSRREGGTSRQPSAGSVQYFTTSISEVNGNTLRMMGGSVWRLNRNYFGLAFQDAIGIMSSQRNALIYANDNVYNATLIQGAITTSSGNLRTVVEKMGDGTILKLDDGTLLEFSSYDRFDTGWWLTPYQVLIDGGGNMWNLEKGKKVWIQRVLR
ncbi:MAG: hypothetical protein WCS09_07150 [Pseudomonadota bacterium]